MDNNYYRSAAEAVLFAVAEPVTAEKIADALEDIAGEVLNVMGIPGSNLLRKPVKAIQEKNAGYLLNSAWGQIIESYR